MEPRKTNRADLERKRPVFLQLGLIIAISASLAAFEWKTPDFGNTVLPPRVGFDPDPDIIDIFKDKKPELPKPPTVTIFNVVDKTTDDFPEIEINIEIDPGGKIEPYKMPEVLPDEPEAQDPEIFYVAEDMPLFPGGDAALMKYLSTNTSYPTAAREAGISGIVYVTFIIETDGSVSSIAVLRSVAGGCTEEAVRVVSEMPAWTPGKQRGKPVRVRMNLPVKFTLVN